MMLLLVSLVCVRYSCLFLYAINHKMQPFPMQLNAIDFPGFPLSNYEVFEGSQKILTAKVAKSQRTLKFAFLAVFNLQNIPETSLNDLCCVVFDCSKK